MRGFVVAHGRSGTTWTAHALRECCGLDARHESMKHHLSGDYDGVEVNGNLWNQVPVIRGAHPDAVVVHQVRDGRLVVRSAISNKWPVRTVEQACTTWAARNERMAGEIPFSDRYCLEDLVRSFDVFVSLALKFDGVPNRRCWKESRSVVQNITRHRCPPFEKWPESDQALFWEICGPTMERMGYER